MILRRAARSAALPALLISAACLALGGAATAEPGVARDSFSKPLPNLSGDELARFALGRAQFRTIRLSGARADGSGGLGPVFNRTSCSGCHVRNGRGRPPEDADGPLTTMVIRLGPGSKYGRQLNDKAIPGVESEGRAVFRPNPIVHVELGGVNWPLRSARLAVREPALGPLAPHVELSPRVAPQIAGIGLLERIPDAVLAELADPDDRNGDGISGRRGGNGAGRFGWRAEVATVKAQVAEALHEDMGVTSTLRPSVNCAAGHAACTARAGGGIEIDAKAFRALVTYVSNLAPPAPRVSPAADAGSEVFDAIGCTACHVAEWELEASPVGVIHPYTDLLLHDLGPALADRRVDGSLGNREWRTAPLWGIGQIFAVNGHRRLLHDGRARGFVEAILWHGGEAASARDRFRALRPADRAALLAFLASL